MNGIPIIENSYLVERILPASIGAGTEIKFDSIPQLNNKIIYALEVYSSSQYAKTSSSATVISSAGITGIVLILNDGSSEFMYTMPAYNLVSSFNGGYIREFMPRVVDFTRSYIKIVDATNLTALQGVAVNFYYRNNIPLQQKRR